MGISDQGEGGGGRGGSDGDIASKIYSIPVDRQQRCARAAIRGPHPGGGSGGLLDAEGRPRVVRDDAEAALVGLWFVGVMGRKMSACDAMRFPSPHHETHLLLGHEPHGREPQPRLQQ